LAERLFGDQEVACAVFEHPASRISSLDPLRE
jgi:hypothetical protein